MTVGPLSSQRIEVFRPNDDIQHPRLRGGFWEPVKCWSWPKPLFLSIDRLVGKGLAKPKVVKVALFNPGETGPGSIAVKQLMCPATKSPTVP